MHQSMLSGTRTFMITGKPRTVRASSDAKSRAVAIMEPGAIGELVSCPTAAGWCQVKAGQVDGWLRRVEFWGAYRNEVFE
jgi:SH3-like domain-containing protein